ncbi:SDR family NAD(P)-dependent oxidoreductase [Aerococcus kribbianus]|uniref:SDR family NAD(P)-dependent oxidoreductase n=1 Tax=Aerococcus kribbianus TaxID=2999064 RepID=A0A9X3FU00_9LACT|nr:SDR family NAD(P)-dependent oxidoreductase [Aerococcus sp. YH-aer222]MCZ0725119.1 SDR family NAD(P)-dependent oxidoreductase [Aerococcus sp. YH-aer222]
MTKDNRTVIVTGGSRGIGKAIAQAFVDNGDFVAILGRNGEKAQETAEELGNAKGYSVDVTDSDSIKDFFKNLEAERGGADVLVNNAGMQYISAVEEFPEEKWDQVIDTILKGSFLMTKHALPYMQDQEYGRIITISSGHGRRPDKFKSAYVAAKFAQLGFTKTVAMENAQKGITANSILPGATNTSLIQNQLADLAERDGSSEQEALETHILGAQWMKQLIEPEEIGATAVFLASDGAAKITGEDLGITGGES